MKPISSAISPVKILVLLLTVGPAFAQHKETNNQRHYLRRDLAQVPGSHGDMRCKSDSQYEVFSAGRGWLAMPMSGGRKCCPGADGKTIMTKLQGAQCPGVLSSATGAGTISTKRTASTSSDMTGDQRCKSALTEYEEFYHGKWNARKTANGTKCCPHLSGEKKIIQQFLNEECPSNMPSLKPSSTPSAVPTNKPSSTPSAVPTSKPSSTPSAVPTSKPSSTPSAVPTRKPSSTPSAVPTRKPSSIPSAVPTSKPSSIPSDVPSDSPSKRPTPAPTPRPTPSPSPSPSCIAGSTRVHLLSSSVKRIDDLVLGEKIQGLDKNKQPATCSIEAIGHFGRGPVHGNYTDDHFVLPSNISEAVSVHGPVGELEVTEKYAVLTSCPVGLDEVGAGFTPVDADFFGGDKNDVSWSDYLLIHASILELVRASGSFWFSPETYQSMEQVRRYTGALYRTMLRCAKDHNDCKDFEKASEDLIENSLTEKSKEVAKTTFHGLGQHRALGSASAVVSKGRSVRK